MALSVVIWWANCKSGIPGTSAKAKALKVGSWRTPGTDVGPVSLAPPDRVEA